MGQVGAGDEGTQKRRATPCLSAQALECRHELIEVVRTAVRQSCLAVVPDALVGVEVWRIGRESLDVQAGMGVDEGLDLLAGMNAAAIPEQHDRPRNLPKEVAQEEHDLGLRDVLPVQVEVETDALPSEAYGDRRNRGDSVVSVAVPDDRRLAPRRPSAPDVRDQQEAAFVQEGQVRLQLLDFF